MNASKCKADLLDRIEAQAGFRDEQAAQHPGDARNERSAAALRALSARITAFPEDSLKLVKLAALWRAASTSERFGGCMELEREILRRYGLDAREGDPELEGDPDDFLAGMIWELETELGHRR